MTATKRDIITLLQLAIGSAKGALKLMEEHDEELRRKSDGNSGPDFLISGGMYRNESRMAGSIEEMEVVLTYVEDANKR